MGFGVGINALIAFYLGAGDQKRADKTATQGMVLGTLHGFVLMAVFLLGMSRFLGLFTESRQVLTLGCQYSKVVFLFSVVVTAGITLEKIFQAVGQMRATMISMIAGFVTNILLDPLLIFGIGPFPRMEITGAALEGERMKKSFGVGIPASLNMALPSFLISALNGILAEFSQSYVLVLGIYYKLQTFIYLPTNGIIQGIRPLIGYNYGAGEQKRVKRIYGTALLMSVGIMAVGTAAAFLIPEQLIGLFTDNQVTIEMGVRALHMISLGFMTSAVSVVSCGALEALGKGLPSLMISLMRYVIAMIPLSFLLSRSLGANGVWMGFAVTELIVAVVSYVIYYRNSAGRQKKLQD